MGWSSSNTFNFECFSFQQMMKLNQTSFDLGSSYFLPPDQVSLDRKQNVNIKMCYGDLKCEVSGKIVSLPTICRHVLLMTVLLIWEFGKLKYFLAFVLAASSIVDFWKLFLLGKGQLTFWMFPFLNLNVSLPELITYILKWWAEPSVWLVLVWVWTLMFTPAHI